MSKIIYDNLACKYHVDALLFVESRLETVANRKEMHISKSPSDKSSHQPDIGNDAGSGNGPVIAIDDERYYNKKIVVVGLGMVALSFMCVYPGNWASLSRRSTRID